jgi:hypothetical protein
LLVGIKVIPCESFSIRLSPLFFLFEEEEEEEEEEETRERTGTRNTP